MGPYKLSHQLNVTMDVAKDYIDKFFKAYPGAQAWIKSVHRECKDTGIVWTLLDRPRRLKEIESAESWVRARAKRQSVNSVVQGSAADLVLSSMIEVDTDERLRELGVKLLLQVHDELLFEVPKENVEESMPIIKELMEYEVGDWDLLVPMPVSIHKGKNWAEAK